MSTDLFRIRDSAKYGGPNREELLGLAAGEVGVEPLANRSTTHSDLRPVKSSRSRPRAPPDYPGPSRLELSSLTDWAIETREKLSSDIPVVHPEGGTRAVVSLATWDVPTSEGAELDVSGAAPRVTPERLPPPAGSVLQELDEIQWSLQRGGSREPGKDDRA